MTQVPGEEEHEERYPSMWIGVVIDDQDPKGVGRVRVRIPGFIDRSRWAWPLVPGGGSRERGLWFTPRVGASVAVFFNQGDQDHPYFLGGNWGSQAPDGEGGRTTEAPARVRDVPVEDRPKLTVIDTDKWSIIIDDRQNPLNDAGEPEGDTGGRNSLLIVSKDDPETFIELDGANPGITMRASVAIDIRTTGLLNLDGTVVQIGGRKVYKNGKPIT